jgi:exosortase
MYRTKWNILALAVTITSLSVLYWPVVGRLVQDWLTDDNSSHGLLIVPLSAYFAWERRHRLRRLPLQPVGAGLVVVAGGLLLLTVGLLGAELFLSRVSLLVVIAGAILFVLGWSALRTLLFPLALLLLMIPIPAIVFNQVAFPLQLIASQVGETGLRIADVPVLREGNTIVLAHTTLEVAEACGGIRSLMSLLTLGIVYAYFADSRAAVRVFILVSTIPLAVLANGARVAGTGIASQYYGPEAADGFFHTFSGWMVFGVAFVSMVAIARILVWLVPAQPIRSVGESTPLKAGI